MGDEGERRAIGALSTLFVGIGGRSIIAAFAGFSPSSTRGDVRRVTGEKARGENIKDLRGALVADAPQRNGDDGPRRPRARHARAHPSPLKDASGRATYFVASALRRPSRRTCELARRARRPFLRRSGLSLTTRGIQYGTNYDACYALVEKRAAQLKAAEADSRTPPIDLEIARDRYNEARAVLKAARRAEIEAAEAK